MRWLNMSRIPRCLFLFLALTLCVGATRTLAQTKPAQAPPANPEVVQDGTATASPTPEMGHKAITVLVFYCVLILLGSMLGGWLPSLVNLTHNRMQLLISLIGGLMLGIGLFHMLPHAIVELGFQSVDVAMIWMMLGMIFMFFLLRMFHFHQHELPETHDHAGHDHDHDCSHPHAHQHDSHDVHKLSWLGVFIGLAIHTLIDGLALGASIKADAVHGDYWLPFGLGTFLAILLHKPLDAVSITSLMKAADWSTGWRTLVNVGFSLMCPLGAGLFFFGLSLFGGNQAVVIGCALAFSAGVFVCIALSDLLPEMEFHSHSRVPLSVALLLGIAIAWGIGLLEPKHAHLHNVSGHTHQTIGDNTIGE
jgi:zinc and cadmium transporter